jgi:hypothetical protein
MAKRVSSPHLQAGHMTAIAKETSRHKVLAKRGRPHMVGVAQRGALLETSADRLRCRPKPAAVGSQTACHKAWDMMCPDAGVTVLSEVAERLMMMFGSDASTFGAKCGFPAFCDFTEVIPPPSRRGHRRRRERAGDSLSACVD